MVVGIIGAGASGMAAALAAAENEGVQVKLFERQARVGRKLQATGNGRCNLTNLQAAQAGYHGEEPRFAQFALNERNPQTTIRWFRELGLFTVTEPSGRVYPYSDQANSVVDVLRLALVKPNIQIYTGFDVQRLRREGGAFLVDNGQESVLCDRIVIACGGLAGTKLGGSMSGYRLLGRLGHKTTRLRPSLVQLKCDWGGVTALKGVRANCSVQILHDGETVSQSTGELQFTDYGLSGPVIFELSRDVCNGAGQWLARLDMLPGYTGEILAEEFYRRMAAKVPMDELLTGVLHNRLGRVLTKAAGVKGKQNASELTEQEIQELIRTVKSFDIVLTEPMGMDNAQVTAGGVLTRDFYADTMESKLIPGLYACGEVLDIDGDCGGYNLQWAWSSGYLAGKNAGKETQ